MKKKLRKNRKNTYRKNDGVDFYNQIGQILIFCGAAWLILLVFISLLPQDYEKYNVSLFFTIGFILALAFIFIGFLPLLLGKYSKRYQVWIEKEWHSYQNRKLKR